MKARILKDAQSAVEMQRYRHSIEQARKASRRRNSWSKHWLDREERHPDKGSCIGACMGSKKYDTLEEAHIILLSWDMEFDSKS